MKKLTIALQVVLVLFFLVPGVMKLLGNPELVAVFEGFGYSTTFMYFIGAAEVLGALGIAIGGRIHRILPYLAMDGLSLIMIGAVYSHVTNGDPITAAVPAGTSLVLMVVYSILLWQKSPPFASKPAIQPEADTPTQN